CKRATYILPALPPLALALGCYLDVVMLRMQAQPFWAIRERRRGSLAYHAALAVLALGFVVALTAAFTQLIGPATGIMLASVPLMALAVVVLVGRTVSWTITAAITFAVLLVGVQLLLPEYNQKYALRNELRMQAARALQQPVKVVCYPQSYDSVSFYLPR